MSQHRLVITGILLTTLLGCASQPTTTSPTPKEESAAPITEYDSRVTAVETTPTANEAHTFAVTLESDETGCDRYANWWEVIDAEGNLLYRRILAHSHVNEQPFTRSGGPVVASDDEILIVRSHMHPTGYSTQAMTGNITNGFEPTTLPANFAAALSETKPLPTNCNF